MEQRQLRSRIYREVTKELWIAFMRCLRGCSATTSTSSRMLYDYRPSSSRSTTKLTPEPGQEIVTQELQLDPRFDPKKTVGRSAMPRTRAGCRISWKPTPKVSAANSPPMSTVVIARHWLPTTRLTLTISCSYRSSCCSRTSRCATATPLSPCAGG